MARKATASGRKQDRARVAGGRITKFNTKQRKRGALQPQ